ncbi:uncharacterized protein LOC132945534 [Metopolophium dirhodum]|uniref:uncharacterized protein LOC132945534 n=1 Tax=Metopolophium dirhodum TaxID=44670 RepID=UPI0029902FE5|nr:uncharacterized protein LOC132945534 [Metopolophium dirhodum]
MDLKFVLFFVQLTAVTKAHLIRIKNNCSFTVWPGIQGDQEHEHLLNGGFLLDAYKTHTFNTPRNWAGRIWGRTNCDSQGKCETGDCGNKIHCSGSRAVPPASFAEMKFTRSDGLDFYHVSMLEGYNLPIRMMPTRYFTYTKKGKYDCKPAECVPDLNGVCPSELAVKAADGSSVVACHSACSQFNTDAYCCLGAYNTQSTCKISSWPKNYNPAFFKKACPNTHSHAFDASTSSFTCRGNAITKYDIIFCPY